VLDLCSAHLLALEYLWAGGESNIFNLGNGMGFSVNEVISSVERAMNMEIPRNNVPRRPGDPEKLISDSKKAKNILGWDTVYPNIDDIVSHAYSWALKNRH
jgi:UDP-glucose 4-epimerase